MTVGACFECRKDTFSMHELQFRHAMYICACKLRRCDSLTFFFFSLLQSGSHTSLVLLPVSSKEAWIEWTARVSDTAMLITMWLSAMEKQGLECFVHLEGPLLHGLLLFEGLWAKVAVKGDW